MKIRSYRFESYRIQSDKPNT